MPYAKTPELEKLRRERIRQSKLGKKRAPFKMPEGWKEKVSLSMKQFWASLSSKEKQEWINKQYNGRIAKHPLLTPEQRKETQKRCSLNYRNKNKAKVYAANRKWVANNLERRREIARLSARRRRLAKNQSINHKSI